MAEHLNNLIVGFLGEDNGDLKSIIEKCYTEPHRKYHTLEHLDTLYNLFQYYRVLFTDEEYSILCASALFHDAIYNVKRDDNEKQSSRLARSWIEQNGVSDDIRKMVERLINDMYEPGENFLNDFFQDADMAILAAPEQIYAEYAENVKEEYTSQFTDDEYISGRKAFLTHLLCKKKIYRTNIFQSTQEAVAISNIFTELSAL